LNVETTTAVPPLVQCPVCNREVPDGAYCGACGAHLASEIGNAQHRHHAYAANPSQHILHPSLVTTLFPHLPHRHRLPFQIAFGVAAAALIVLGLLRWTGPAIALAALAVPLIYLLQLYEVEVYEDEPVLIIGTTLIVGVVLGALWAHFSGPIVTKILLQDNTLGTSPGRLLVGGVILPLAAQILMVAGGLALYFRRRYDEALDGFTFGVAGALGFTAASTIIYLWPELNQGLVSSATQTESVLDALFRGVLTPFVNASLAGIICGALWLRRGATRRVPYHWLVVGLIPAIVVVVAIRVLLGLESVIYLDTLTGVATWGAAAIFLLVWVRVVLHYMLLTEAVEVPIGPEGLCSHCHHIVPRMAFCPNCGIATRATPKSGAGRINRAVRQGAV
jgi:RsiW-degrading membrane proteinase PrsW (M82 family)